MNQFSALLDWKVWFIPVLLAVLLILSSLYSYLLFHTLAELFTIIIGIMMFVIALYTYNYAANNFLLYLAIGYFWVAGIDIVHTLIYKGMSIFNVDVANHTVQFWIVGRYMEAFVLLSAPLLLTRKLHPGYTFTFFGLMATISYISIMDGNFPVCFIEGEGLTSFKIISEYIICLVLAFALINLYTHRQQLKDDIFPFLSFSIAFTICAELAFTNYISIYGLSNLVGHIFKVFSYWLIFYSLVRHSLKFPYESLQATSSLLTALRDGIPDLIFYKNTEGVYLGCNQAFCDFLGKKDATEIVGRTDYDIFDKALADFFRHKDVTMLKANTPVHNDEWVTYPDGKRILLDTLKSPFLNAKGEIIGILGISRDITERKQLEASNLTHIKHLENMEHIAKAVSGALTPDQMLHNAIEKTREIFASDRAWLLFPCNPEADFWEVPLEATKAEYPGAFTLNQKVPMSPEIRRVLEDALLSSKAVVYCPMPSLGAQGEQFTVRSQIVIAIKSKFGEPWLFGLHQCSYERMWSEEEKNLFESIAIRISDILSAAHLSRDLQKLSQAVQQAGEAVMITDQNATIEYVNPAYTKITGYSAEDVIGKVPAVFKNNEHEPSVYKEIRDTLLQDKDWRGKLTERRKNGSLYSALVSVSPIRNEKGEITHFIALQQDISAYQKMEEQFLHAQKMEAIGTLVGGIAHDFNNMLAAVQGNVYLAKRKLLGQPEVAAKLDNIELLGKRSADMVKQLLTFSRKDHVDLQLFSLNIFIKEAYKLAQMAIPENIELICDPCQENLMITGDATQLQQALMNLLNNARDAVTHVNQPKISCRLRPFSATDEFRNTHPYLDHKHFAQLKIQDNGSGIASDHLNKIFEPFFTTKNVGEGTGLGLAMVYGAVQSHGGVIEAKNNDGEGTSFYIYLPLKEGVEKSEENDVSIFHGQGETILLVDDEKSILEITAEVLNSFGYAVLKAGDGQEALAIFTKQPENIDIILSDIVMPKLSGLALAKAVRQLDENVPIIFATGYDKDQVVPSLDQIPQSIIVNKPFSFEDISLLIKTMLTQKP